MRDGIISEDETMSLESLMKERDEYEQFKDRYEPHHLPNIERNDEIDYEIDRILYS